MNKYYLGIKTLKLGQDSGIRMLPEQIGYQPSCSGSLTRRLLLMSYSFTMLAALVGVVLGLVPLVASLYNSIGNLMLPCPDVHPQASVSIDELLGSWHLSLMVVDATEEDFAESAVCVSGELVRHNATTVRQVWTMTSAPGETSAPGDGEPVAMIELPTAEVRPGVWAVHTPLGGELKAVVFESDPSSYMLVCHCGWHHGSLVHLWTAAISRSRVLSPPLRHYLASALENHGFHPLHTKIVSWHGC